MDAVERELRTAVERQRGGTAHLAYIDAVSVRFQDRSVWDGIVLVFDLCGHREAERAYAWFSPTDGDERRLHVVPHGPPIRSAQDAVIAAFAGDIHLADSPNLAMGARSS